MQIDWSIIDNSIVKQIEKIDRFEYAINVKSFIFFFQWTIKIRNNNCIAIKICDVINFWLIDMQNRNVELNELIKTTNLNVLINLSNLNDLNDLTSIAICEIFIVRLIEKQNQNVELKRLIKIFDLRELIDVKFD